MAAVSDASMSSLQLRNRSASWAWVNTAKVFDSIASATSAPTKSVLDRLSHLGREVGPFARPVLRHAGLTCGLGQVGRHKSRAQDRDVDPLWAQSAGQCLGESVGGELRCDVGGRIPRVGPDARDGRCVDHVSGAPFEHGRHEGSHPPDQAEHVDLKDPLPVGRSLLAQVGQEQPRRRCYTRRRRGRTARWPRLGADRPHRPRSHRSGPRWRRRRGHGVRRPSCRAASC